jgi:hypothetical protein
VILNTFFLSATAAKFSDGSRIQIMDTSMNSSMNSSMPHQGILAFRRNIHAPKLQRRWTDCKLSFTGSAFAMAYRSSLIFSHE